MRVRGVVVRFLGWCGWEGCAGCIGGCNGYRRQGLLRSRVAVAGGGGGWGGKEIDGLILTYAHKFEIQYGLNKACNYFDRVLSIYI